MLFLMLISFRGYLLASGLSGDVFTETTRGGIAWPRHFRHRNHWIRAFAGFSAIQLHPFRWDHRTRIHWGRRDWPICAAKCQRQTNGFKQIAADGIHYATAGAEPAFNSICTLSGGFAQQFSVHSPSDPTFLDKRRQSRIERPESWISMIFMLCSSRCWMMLCWSMIVAITTTATTTITTGTVLLLLLLLLPTYPALAFALALPCPPYIPSWFMTFFTENHITKCLLRLKGEQMWTVMPGTSALRELPKMVRAIGKERLSQCFAEFFSWTEIIRPYAFGFWHVWLGLSDAMCIQ